MRDTGCEGPTLVHPDFIEESDYTGEHVCLRGVFDSPSNNHRVPLAVVKLSAPSLNCERDVSVTVGVPPLVEFNCLIGNSLFRENSEFTDIFAIGEPGVHRTRRQFISDPQQQRGEKRGGEQQKVIDHRMSVASGRVMTQNNEVNGRDLTDSGVYRETGETPLAVNDEVRRGLSDSLTGGQGREASDDDGRQVGSDEDKQTDRRVEMRPDSSGVEPELTDNAAAPSGGQLNDGNSLTLGGDSDQAYDEADALTLNGSTDQLINLPKLDPDGGCQTATSAQSTRDRDKPVGATGVDAHDSADGVVSATAGDGNAQSEQVNQATTVRITTRAGRLKTGHKDETDTDSESDTQADGYENESDTDAGNTLAANETNLTDEAIRELSHIDMTCGNMDQTDFHTKTETARKFAEDQQNDKGLAIYWQRAETGSSEFVVIDKLLYKRKTFGGLANGESHSLVVPKSYETEIIKAAHSHPFGGHLGRNKCCTRIFNHFWFPKLKSKIADYITKCHECQVTAGKQRKERAPLEPIHVLNAHPFQEIEIDILSDLPTTARRNKHLLTIVCLNSKWVEALPLPNCKADTIADKLIEFFSSTSIPRVIRSDNMPSFRSEILTALRRKLGIEAKFSAPYHAQSHGAIERTNKTIEQMLRKFILDNEKQWDKLIPFLLFAIRDIPNSSTKVSPAELVYGRKMRG